jgi:hypothetical protein
VVLSLPPIINSEHSKITLKTKNVFIEVTAIDATKAHIVLNTLCALFSEYCQEKYTYSTLLFLSLILVCFSLVSNKLKSFKLMGNRESHPICQ